MKLNYVKFTSMSIKARMHLVQEKLGLPVTCKRDKVTVKAIQKLQSDNGITPNGVICESTYKILFG